MGIPVAYRFGASGPYFYAQPVRHMPPHMPRPLAVFRHPAPYAHGRMLAAQTVYPFMPTVHAQPLPRLVYVSQPVPA
jgi:hypothetical protein